MFSTARNCPSSFHWFVSLRKEKRELRDEKPMDDREILKGLEGLH